MKVKTNVPLYADTTFLFYYYSKQLKFSILVSKAGKINEKTNTESTFDIIS